MTRRSDDGFHIASIAHDGRLWTAYLEFDDDPHAPRSYRARIRFEPAAGAEEGAATRTAIIIIEDSYEEAMAKARTFDERQLAGLLRSTLPDDGVPPKPPTDESSGKAEGEADPSPAGPQSPGAGG